MFSHSNAVSLMRVNEIFYSIQGEGHFAGVPAVFVRLSGCNLACSFCDTDFQSFTEMTEEEIVQAVETLGGKATHVVLTGGEPSLQVTPTLCDKLHKAGKFIQMETNGTHEVTEGIDFVTCSPKFEFCKHAELKVKRIDELKVVYTLESNMARYEKIEARYRSLQPCDTGDVVKNKQITMATVEYCKAHPEWRVSLQTHKILDVR